MGMGAQNTEARLAASVGQLDEPVAPDFQAAQDLIAEISKDFDSIDVLINNAGITKDTLVGRMSLEDFQSVLNINLFGNSLKLKLHAHCNADL